MTTLSLEEFQLIICYKSLPQQQRNYLRNHAQTLAANKIKEKPKPYSNRNIQIIPFKKLK